VEARRAFRIRHPPTAYGHRDQPSRYHQVLGDLGGQVFREVFDRPFPEPLPRWDDEAAQGSDLWVTEGETREEIIGFYRRVGVHSDATISALDIDAPGHVPWWPRPDVKLFNILAHILIDTSRHAGHADILREQLDGKTGFSAEYSNSEELDSASWEERRAKIERAAQATVSRQA